MNVKGVHIEWVVTGLLEIFTIEDESLHHPATFIMQEEVHVLSVITEEKLILEHENLLVAHWNKRLSQNRGLFVREGCEFPDT